MLICQLIYFTSTLTFSKNVPDYTASREKNDLGFINFDLNAGKLTFPFGCIFYCELFLWELNYFNMGIILLMLDFFL